MSAISKVFQTLKQNGQTAYIPFLTIGFPSLEETLPLLHAMQRGGADMIELGVPFSDPMADGATIQQASQIALQEGVTLKKCLEIVAKARREGITVPLIFMGYCNPFFQYGVSQFAQDAKSAGVDGIIVADLPPGQAVDWVPHFRKQSIDTIFLVSPNTKDLRIKEIVKWCSGFVYCVAVTGVTGARKDLAISTSDFLKRVRKFTELPIALGFGISTTEHVRFATNHCDGAVMASELLKGLTQEEKSQRVGWIEQKVKSFKMACHSR